MKKLKLFFACLLMSILSIGQMWAVDYELVYTLDGSVTTGGNNNYAQDGDGLTQDGVDWSVTGNTTINPWRIGGKNLDDVDREAYSKTAISDNIAKIEIEHGTKTLSAVNSMTVIVASNSDFSTVVSSFTPTFEESKTVTISRPDGKDWSNCYYKIVYNVDAGSSNSYLQLKSVKFYKEQVATAFTITAQSNDNSKGTVSLSGSVITGSPKAGFRYASPAYSVSPANSATVSQNGNAFTVTPNANTTVTINFEAIPQYTVTWNNNGVTSTSQVYEGAKPEFPAAPAACDATSTTFIGWATAPWDGKLANLSEKTVYTSADAMPAVNADVTYYAVFAKSSGSASDLFTWAGGTKSELTSAEGVYALTADNGDYADSHAPYRVKWNTDGMYIIIEVASQPGKVSAGFKMIGGGTTSNIYVQEADATDGTYTDVETLDISGSSSAIVNVETSQSFKSTTRAIKLLYHKGSNVGLGPISIESAVSMSDYMTTCCTKYNVNIAAGIENGSVSADPASACEGATITLTFTPALNYHLSAWTLNGAAQDVNVNTFSMLAGAATVSATFAQDACDPLATPVVAVSGKAYPYNAVKLAWTAIEHADAYKVYIYDNEDNELEHNDAFAGVEYTIGQTLSASTTYKYSVQAISNTPATYCPSTEAENTFTTDALPTAHLTLIALGDEHEDTGDYSILTPFNLPSTAAACSKTFRGWDANSECATAPTYAAGAEFTFQNTTGVTLYAVYADETPGEAIIKTDVLDYEFTGLTGTSYKTWSGKTGTSGAVYAGQSCALGNNPQSTFIQLRTNNSNSGVVTTGTGAGKVTKVTVTWNAAQGNDGIKLDVYGKNTAYTQATDLYGDNAGTLLGSIVKGTSTELVISGSYTYLGLRSNNGTVYLDEIDVQWTAQGESSYDNYSTDCQAQVATPTITPDGSADYYTTAQNVTITAEEDATIYYTMDGTTPTASSTKYTEAISLTERGEYTIKAIAVKAGKANSDVAEAIIKINLPFANLADLVTANLASGSEVIVSFADEVITDNQYISQGTKRAGVMLTTTAGSSNNAIEIFYNKGTTVVPAEWLIGGSLSATSMTFTWTLYNEQWELVPLGNDWTWENGDLTYTAPKEVSSVVITGAPTKTSYVDGELFKPAGLTVTVSYTVGEPEVNPVGLTFACTPERVAKSDDPVSVSVVATFNEVSSEAFNVTGLTVGDIQLKTIQEFITAGNADMRCYLEGTVSNYTNTTKGYFDLTDESATIYIYGCDAPSSFAAGDKIKVIAEDYDYYNTKHEAKNVQFVSKKPVATMTFDAMEMETGDVETIAPKTITEAEASAVAYSIKEGSDDCVTIDNENKKITATAAGSATIVATLAETADYVGATVEFAVTVTAPDLRSIANSPAEFDAVSGDLDPTDIKFAAYKGDGTTEPATTSNSYIRLYKPASGKTTGGYLTLTALMGFKIDQVQITFDGNATASYAVDNDAFSTEAYITGQASLLTPAGLEAQSVTIVNLKNGSIDISAIKVWYDGEALAIHHYILGGTYETTFEQNTTFSYEGLTVTAAYDELETITEPITDFTVVADLSEAGPATASVRRNNAEIATYNITVTPGKANPNLAYTPNELELAAADVASWVAPVFSNPFEVSPITYSSNKTAVAKVTNAGVITLEGGYGTAVITASYAGDDDYIASQATYTITVNEPIDDIKGHWVAANAVQAGMEIIIANVADANGNVKTMGAQNSNNRAAVASTVNESGVLSPASGTKIFTLVDAGSGNYNIKSVNNNYLYAASGSSNHLKEEATPDANGNADWAISFANGKATIIAQGNNARNWMRYNSDNNIFSCYASGQEDIIIYAINEEVKEGETIDASSLREDEDIVINGDASIEINQEVSLGDIHVKANKTVTIEVTEDATLGNLDLENGAILDLDITPGATVAANDLILRSNSADRNAQQGKSSQAPGVLPAINGILALEIDLRPELAADATLSTEQSEKWYCISAPFDVDINSGFEWVYPDGHRTAMIHNTDFQIFAYDGARRATGISGWKRTSGTMKAGVAHFIGFDNARTNQKVIRLTAKNNTVAPATEISLGSYPGAAAYQNWNGVANPTLQYIGINKNIVAFDYGIQDYNTYAADDYNYFVGSPFFIQQDGGSIVIDYNDRGGAIHAPQREAETLAYCVRINAASANCFESQLYVRASETASDTYEEGHDMASQSSTTPKYGARIWSENYNMRLGIEEAPLTNGNASYVLGIATPAAGEYTISVAAPKENATLYLTYNGSIIWNLSNGAYTIDLPKGITSGYGLVMQAKAPQVGTDIESQTAIVNGVEKVVINNTIYILRDQQMYDLTGKMVK